MGEFIKRLIRWIIFIIIVVLLILLIVKLANKNKTATKTKKVLDSGVETIKKETKKFNTDKTINEETTKKEENNQDEIVTSTVIVDTPDTGTNAKGIVLGIIVIASGTYYIYKNRNLITE